jgi:F0F1-type ATP synthase assembly protein I
MLFRPKAKDVNPHERAVWADLMSLGMVFPIAILLGIFIGRWIGGYFGHRQVGLWIGLTWGVATGFWELYKVTKKLDRMDEFTKKQDDSKEKNDDHKSQF